MIRRDNKQSQVFSRRVLAMMGVQTAILGALGVRLWSMQILEGERYAVLAEGNRISTRLTIPARGRLLDRGGDVLAGNQINWRVLLVAEQAGDVNAVLSTLSQILPLTEAERSRVDREIARRRRFVPVVVREFLSWDEMVKVEVNAPDLPGIMTDVGTTRFYPYDADLAHVIGYVAPPSEDDLGEDPLLEQPGVRVGRAGLEKTHETALRGRAGTIQYEVNAAGRIIRELDRQEGQSGVDVHLTLDGELQKAVCQRLGEESASAVILDVRNGEVLVMATNPSFDPSLFNSGVSRAQWQEWTSNRRAPLINKAGAGLYSPGSTYKMMVGLAALEAKAVTPTERLPCWGHYDLGNARFHCWYRPGHGSLDLRGAIKYSCDCYFYEAARRTGIDRIAAMSNRFGLGVMPSLELPNMRAGLIPTRAWRQAQGGAWAPGDTVVHGIGQGFTLVTPLQLATMTARLALGRSVQPHLTKAIGGVALKGGAEEDWPVLDIAERDLRLVREGMWAVVNEGGGTAGRTRLPNGVVMAGKTGTTQVRRVTRQERERGFRAESLPWEFRPHALYVGYAPYDQPRYACAVVVEHGLSGAMAAGPIARDIMVETFARNPLGRTPPNLRTVNNEEQERGS